MDPNDDVPLTPNHFLHGQMGGQLAPELTDEKVFNVKKRWRRIPELVKHFWQRWMKEWLPALNSRKKWHHPQKDVQVGEIVLVVSPDTQRGQWPLGRVTEVFSGRRRTCTGGKRTSRTQRSYSKCVEVVPLRTLQLTGQRQMNLRNCVVKRLIFSPL